MTDAAFDGETYSPAQDKKRLKGQLERVQSLMLDGEWRSLKQIVERIGGSEAGVSARLRDLRKIRYGSHVIERHNAGRGLWLYRIAKTT